MNVIKVLEEHVNYEINSIEKLEKYGDMPGDKVQIDEIHIQKAKTIFSRLVKELPAYFEKQEKMVLTVCGGSGVGKSEIASLLTFFFQQIGIGCYTLSGDNYPHRIPSENDAMRLSVYEKEGKEGLEKYLGTESEIGFEELSNIIKSFKEGKESISLRRMGRTKDQLWYDDVDFSQINIMIIEWTHGNSDFLDGVDYPILLNSTPEETLEHRKSRNRDGSVDSPFTQLVLEIEQEKLKKQAIKAKIILSKSGSFLEFKDI